MENEHWIQAVVFVPRITTFGGSLYAGVARRLQDIRMSLLLVMTLYLPDPLCAGCPQSSRAHTFLRENLPPSASYLAESPHVTVDAVALSTVPVPTAHIHLALAPASQRNAQSWKARPTLHPLGSRPARWSRRPRVLFLLICVSLKHPLQSLQPATATGAAVCFFPSSSFAFPGKSSTS